METESKYILHFMYYGWEEEKRSNDLDYLIEEAKEMIENNTGKPLIITNKKDEIVREFTPRVFHNDLAIYSTNFKGYKETMIEIGKEPW